MDQPTAMPALKELEVLVGEWTMEMAQTGGEPIPAEACSTFAWHESDAYDRRPLGDRGGRRELPEGLRSHPCPAQTRLPTVIRAVCGRGLFDHAASFLTRISSAYSLAPAGWQVPMLHLKHGGRA
jgi:hypothetical protein